MDIYSYLKKDHKKVADLIEQVASGEASNRQALFDEIKQELTIHADTEEPTFYAAIEHATHAKSTEEKIEHAEEEHEELKVYLEKLSSMDSKQAEWLVCFGEFKHAVAHHVEGEEGKIFEKAKKLLSPAQAKQLAVDMEALKQQRATGKKAA